MADIDILESNKQSNVYIQSREERRAFEDRMKDWRKIMRETADKQAGKVVNKKK